MSASRPQFLTPLKVQPLKDGSKPEAVALPMPGPLFFDDDRLPASYANFYILNAAVLVPTFNDPKDRVALGILGGLSKDRPVVGIRAAATGRAASWLLLVGVN